MTWLAPAAALSLTFSLINWINLTWEKQLHVTMSLLFLVIAAHCSAGVSVVCNERVEPKVRPNLMFTMCAALAAKFSFGYGLPVMPVITIHGILARWPLRHVIISASFSIISVGAYYYFFSLGGRSPRELTDVTFDPLVMIAYMARLLAGAVAATDFHRVAGIEPNALALMVGLALLGIYFFGTTRLYWRSLWFRKPPSRCQSVSLIISSVCVAIALMTLITRPIETQGVVERYYIVSTFFILSLTGLFAADKYHGHGR